MEKQKKSLFRAKKSLGQHFLNSPKVLSQLIEAAGIEPTDTVLEIGPGLGSLTQKLLEKSQKVIAVEKDERLITLLEQQFAQPIQKERLTIVPGDILLLDLPFGEETTYKVIANIPYYITGQLIRKFLTIKHKPQSMTLLLQKEVAKRIVAEKESLLSISVKSYGNPRYVATVKRGLFKPIPRVDSAILHIARISEVFFKEIDQKKFFEIVRLGFSQKRKKLIGNLSALYKKEDLIPIFRECGLEENIRAEDVSPEKWQQLVIQLQNLQ